MVAKRIYITLPAELVIKVEKYNQNHPDKPISYSGTCRKALEAMNLEE